MASVVEESWQTTRSTIRERSKFMLTNELLSDVKFLVPASNGESSETKVIPAHKFVLSISSPVFLAMFYGEMAETKDSIFLPDCEYDCLLELFRFMYCDEVNLSGNNVMQVLYLAKKYIMPALVIECTKYLQENMDTSNVFCILPLAQKFEEKDLVDRCWEVIDVQTEEFVQSDDFVTLERSVVQSVVKRDSLNAKEVELFKAVDRWATKESGRQGLNPDGDVKRRILGEGIVTAIRFPLMSREEFVSVVPGCNILTKEEVVNLTKHYSDNVLETPSLTQFLETPRRGTFHRCRRFGKSDPPLNSWHYYRGRPDNIYFLVNKNINLHGVRLYGSEGNKYTVTLEVKGPTDSPTSVVKKSGAYFSEKDNIDGHYGFDVLLHRPVRLEAGVKYHLVALINGPISWYGEEGKRFVDNSGVKFTFSGAEIISYNGTHTNKGQFADILFSSL